MCIPSVRIASSWRHRLFILAAMVACSPLGASKAEAIEARLVAVGAYHTCIVNAHGSVECWGQNGYGQLGNGSTSVATGPADVGLTDVVAVVAGYAHTCVLTGSGAVKCWGGNYRGQLGDGTTTTRTVPVDVVLGGAIATSIAAGAYHTCAMTLSSGVKCWGGNDYGQLGDGTQIDHHFPADVSALTSGVASIASGYAHTCAVLTTGTVKCWGNNSSGQLGDGTTTDRVTPVTVGGLSGAAVASAGSGHTCVVTQTGGVKCWGGNYSGQLGDGSINSRGTPGDVSGLTSGVLAVAAGGSHSCAVTVVDVKCWGSNSSGQLGDGTTMNRLTPVPTPGTNAVTMVATSSESHTCAVTWQGYVLCWGDNRYGQAGQGAAAYVQPVTVSGLTPPATALSVGEDSGCAVTSLGGVKCWGSNWGGQLGDGTKTGRATAADVSSLGSGVVSVSSGAGHACALTTGGAVKCWGWNASGQLGDGTTTDSLVPVSVSGLGSGVLAVAVGTRHTCAIVTPGAVKCWGGGGLVGDGTTTQRLTPTSVSIPERVVSIATASHTCVATLGGKAYCWGENYYGQLGDGTTTDSTSPVLVSGLSSGVASISVGSGPNASPSPASSCAVMTNGTIRCWGHNDSGQLGDGTTTDRVTPVQVSGLTGATAVSVGPLHTCALAAGNRVWCWGDNADGELGDGTTTGSSVPVRVTVLGTAPTTVAVGGWTYAGHTCALVGSSVQCWGNDQLGQVGSGRFLVTSLPYAVRSFGPATAADFDADWKMDPAVYRPSTGTWFWLRSSTSNQQYAYKGWGVQAQGDMPISGDFDGDGIMDPTVFRPSTGTWFILTSSNGGWTHLGWGQAGDTAVPADYDGDGVTDLAIYRASTGQWYIRPSSGATQWSVVFGAAGDVPLRGGR